MCSIMMVTVVVIMTVTIKGREASLYHAYLCQAYVCANESTLGVETMRQKPH